MQRARVEPPLLRPCCRSLSAQMRDQIVGGGGGDDGTTVTRFKVTHGDYDFRCYSHLVEMHMAVDDGGGDGADAAGVVLRREF